MTEKSKTPPRVCPGCQSAMQTLMAGEVALERCFFCGGVYLDQGELDRLVGKPVALTPGDAPGKRVCAGCGATLVPTGAGPVTVDRCPTCAGIYLDAGEMERLAGKVDLKRAEADTASDGALKFTCPGCDETFDVDEAVTTADGLFCPRCAPGVGTMEGEGLLDPSGAYVNTNGQLAGEDGLRLLGQVLNGLRTFLRV